MIETPYSELNFKAIIDAGGPRGEKARQTIQQMARYFELCAELQDVEETLSSGARAASSEVLLRRRDELYDAGEAVEREVVELYRAVRDWKEVPE